MSRDCLDGTTHVHVTYASSGSNDFQVTFARVDLPGMPATVQASAIYFLISEHCRIGIALNGVGVQQAVGLYNLVTGLGGRLVCAYVTTGQYDAVLVVEMPDGDSMTKLSVALTSRGNVRTTTVRAYSAEEFGKIAAAAP